MGHLLLTQTQEVGAFLGLQDRYWIIIIIVAVIVMALRVFAARRRR